MKGLSQTRYAAVLVKALFISAAPRIPSVTEIESVISEAISEHEKAKTEAAVPVCKHCGKPESEHETFRIGSAHIKTCSPCQLDGNGDYRTFTPAIQQEGDKMPRVLITADPKPNLILKCDCYEFQRRIGITIDTQDLRELGYKGCPYCRKPFANADQEDAQ